MQIDKNVYLNAYQVKAFGFGADLSLNDFSSVPPQVALNVRILDYLMYKQHFPTWSCLGINFPPAVVSFQGEYYQCNGDACSCTGKSSICLGLIQLSYWLLTLSETPWGIWDVLLGLSCRTWDPQPSWSALAACEWYRCQHRHRAACSWLLCLEEAEEPVQPWGELIPVSASYY